jgi:hypothetical protein
MNESIYVRRAYTHVSARVKVGGHESDSWPHKPELAPHYIFMAIDGHAWLEEQFAISLSDMLCAWSSRSLIG